MSRSSKARVPAAPESFSEVKEKRLAAPEVAALRNRDRIPEAPNIALQRKSKADARRQIQNRRRPSDPPQLHGAGNRFETTAGEASLDESLRPQSKSPPASRPASVGNPSEKLTLAKSPTLQPKFELEEKICSKSRFEIWKTEHNIEIPSTLDEIVDLLFDSDRVITLETFESKKDPAESFVDFLYAEIDAHETDEIERMFPSTSKVDGKLGQSSQHSEAQKSSKTKFTELAHVTFKASAMDGKEIDPDYSSSRGEFGKGFYLATGHDKKAQERISDKWKNPKTGKAPIEIVRFKIANETLEQIVDKDQDQLKFLIYMLQYPNGYPKGVSETQAIKIMNAINVKGRVLIFPDNKDLKISIKSKLQMSWSEYTSENRAPSQHFLVIGPQRPKELKGIRQIAVRGTYGKAFINIATRSQEKMYGKREEKATKSSGSQRRHREEKKEGKQAKKQQASKQAKKHQEPKQAKKTKKAKKSSKKKRR